MKFNSDNHSFQQSFSLANNFFSITTVRTLCELSTLWIYTDEIIFCNDSPRTAAIFFVTICILRLVFKFMLILSTNLYYMDYILIMIFELEYSKTFLIISPGNSSLWIIEPSETSHINTSSFMDIIFTKNLFIHQDWTRDLLKENFNLFHLTAFRWSHSPS